MEGRESKKTKAWGTRELISVFSDHGDIMRVTSVSRSVCLSEGKGDLVRCFTLAHIYEYEQVL